MGVMIGPMITARSGSEMIRKTSLTGPRSGVVSETF
jgi:hypothetical protein